MRTAVRRGLLVLATWAAAGSAAAGAQPASPPPDAGSVKTATLGPSLRFDVIDRNTGLPQNGVQSIAQDKTGFIWLGTADGLARWDGQRFLVLRHDPADTQSLGASFVSELLVARDGTLWVGTVGGGVNRYRNDGSSFDRFAARPGEPDALQSGSVLSLTEGPDGRIWVGTDGGGLGILDQATGKVRTFSTEDGLNAVVSAVHAGKDGAVWVGTAAGVFRFEGNASSFQPVLPDNQDLADAIITVLRTDQAGDLWIGTEESGLARYTPAGGKIVWHRADPANPDRLQGDSIKTIYQDRNGRLWVGGQQVLHLLDPATGRFVRHRADPQDPRSLPDTPLDVFQDAAGVIWVGTFDGGAAMLESSGIASYRTPAPVTSLFARDKDLWVTSGDAACHWRGAGSFEGACYPVPGATAVVVDRAGTSWIGTAAEGLYRMDAGGRGQFTTYRPARRNDSLAAGGVARLLEDRAGNLWIAHTSGGLQRFDRRKNAFVSYQLPTAELLTVKEDPTTDGLLWLGTANRGLVSLEVASGKTVELVPRKDDPANRSDNAVADFAFDGERVVWLATLGGGLKRLDRQSGQVKSYQLAQGMPSDTLYALRRDQAGRLWVSTSAGLVQFDPKSEKPVHFTLADGLQGPEYSLGAAEVTPDGRLVFGGAKGFDLFAPAEVRIDSYRPPLVVTSIQVLGEPLATARPVSTIKSLSLAHDEAFVAVEFAALSFAGSDRFQFEYQIEGASDRWLTSRSAVVSLAGLDDGDHRLLLRARNRHGVESAPIALSIHVAPPLWRRWYALTAYGLVLGGLIFAVFRYQRARIDRMRKMARLAAVEREFEISAAVQSWFLPDAAMHRAGGCDLVGFYRGAEKCSGDWWWYEEVGHDKLWVIVADVTGHGAGPAMLTAAVAMGIWVQRSGLPPTYDEVVGRLNRVNREVLNHCKGKATMTMTAALIDHETGQVDIYSLGGVPALLIARQGKHSVLGASGTPLGSVPRLDVGSRSTQLDRGDRLIITTDGIIETTLAGGRPLGMRRFVNVLRDVQEVPINLAVQRIIDNVDVARAAQPQEDDFTFCMLERR